MVQRSCFAAFALLAGSVAAASGPAQPKYADIGIVDTVVPWEYRCLLFTPDDRHLIAGDQHGGLHFWEVRTGKCVKTLWLPRGWPQPTFNGAISPDGRRLAVACGWLICVLDLATDRVVAQMKAPMPGDFAYSPDGKTLAAIVGGHLLKLWDADTGACRRTIQRVSGRAFRGLAWSPDGKSLATTEEDGPLRRWDVATGKQHEVARDSGFSRRLLWRGDGQALALYDHVRWRVVDLTGKELAKGADGQQIAAVRFDPDGRLTILNNRGEPEELELLEGVNRRKARPSPGHPLVGGQAALSASGDLCASHDKAGAVIVRSLLDGKERIRTPLRREEATKVGWSADGKALLWTASRTGPSPKPPPPTERKFHLAELRLDKAPADAKRTTAKLKDAHREITRDTGYSYDLIRLKERKTISLQPSFTADDFYVRSVTLLADERAAVNSDWGLALHDTITGKELFNYSPGADGAELAPSPDGRSFATSGTTIGVYSLTCRLVSLHVVGDRWVVWSAAGHYAAAWDGDLPVGRFVDRGPGELSEFVPLNRFKDHHRPEVVHRLLAGGGVEKAPPPEILRE